MEETVRSMLVYKKQAEQLRQEKAALTVAFEVSRFPVPFVINKNALVAPYFQF